MIPCPSNFPTPYKVLEEVELLGEEKEEEKKKRRLEFQLRFRLRTKLHTGGEEKEGGGRAAEGEQRGREAREAREEEVFISVAGSPSAATAAGNGERR